MVRKCPAFTLVLFAAVLLAALSPARAPRADEGMWTYDQVPSKLLKERYGFTTDAAFLDHLRLSSVNLYASASFVSADGLILTNHHVALGAVQRLSTPENNFVRDGFFAASLADEISIPGTTVSVLLSINDVTERVHGAIKAGATAAEAQAQQEAAMAKIEDEVSQKGGGRGEVVTLYGGSRHVLYRYKEYADVRLVFVPELQAAFFGGDYDNFTYPRYDLDLAFLRAYEDGKPANVSHFLATNAAGAKAGDLVFVSGHPGSTDRLQTYAMLEYLRDLVLPDRLTRLKERRELLNAYSKRGPEQARRARTYLYFIENSIKSAEGEFGGLKDPSLMATKKAAETALRAAVAKDPSISSAQKAWPEIDAAMVWARAHEKERAYKTELGRRGLLGKALEILRYSEEAPKPDNDRLPDFHEADLPELVRDLQTPSPIFKDLEEVVLTYELQRLLDGLGAGDPLVKALLGGQSPAAAARRALEGSKLDDAALRKELMKDKGRAVAKCKDPLLELARLADPIMRETQKQFRERVDAVQDQSLTQIAQAAFAVYGTDTYPDATGTLRLAFGKVAGYPFATTLVPPFTTYYGLFDRAYSFGNEGDFKLPSKTEAAKERIDPMVPLNFVCTADITGGNSGSPVVDREGRLVGLVFDGNMQSHPNTFVYDEKQARCVAVDIRGILEALRKIYGANRLADEMVAGKMK
jgi:hypothetical protein